MVRASTHSMLRAHNALGQRLLSSLLSTCGAKQWQANKMAAHKM